MRRAIDKANGKLVVLVIFAGSHFSVAFLAHLCKGTVSSASAAVGSDKSEGNSIRALITEIQKEEIKIHIDLDKRIKVATCVML